MLKNIVIFFRSVEKMIQGNYERIMNKIATAAGMTVSDLESMVEAKRNKLSGLISKEGAAQVIAKELGVSFEQEKLKIDELLPGMRQVNLVGKVIEIFPVRSFKTKKGDESKVVNFWVADDKANVKVVLWDTNHVALIEKGEIKKDDVVEILNGAMRDNELHLGNFSNIKKSEETLLGEIVTKKTSREKNIADFKKGENVSVRAFVVQMFEPKSFQVCPECGKKVVAEADSFSCLQHGKIVPEKRFIANLVIDDGTDSMKAVAFHKTLPQLGFTDMENQDLLLQQRENLLGKEMVFSGNVRTNAFFNTDEFIVDTVSEADLNDVIQKLEVGA